MLGLFLLGLLAGTLTGLTSWMNGYVQRAHEQWWADQQAAWAAQQGVR